MLLKMTNRTCLFFLGKPTKDSFAFFTILWPNKNYPDGQIKDFIKSILSHSRTLQVPIGVDPLGHLFGVFSINACFALSQILFQSHQQKFSATTMRLEFRTPFVFNIGQGIGRVKCKTNWNKIKIIFFRIVWKSQKSLIQHCERSELRLHFEWTKVD